MSLTKHLMQYSSVLSNARPKFFLRSLLDGPTIAGSFQGYEAEFGIMNHNQEYPDVFFRIALKSPVHVPLFLRDRCPVSPGDNVDLCWGKWFTITEPIDSYRVKLAIDKLGERSVQERFERLAKVARNLESGRIPLSETIAARKKDMLRAIAIIIPLGFLVVAGFYWAYLWAMRW